MNDTYFTCLRVFTRILRVFACVYTCLRAFTRVCVCNHACLCVCVCNKCARVCAHACLRVNMRDSLYCLNLALLGPLIAFKIALILIDFFNIFVRFFL